MHFSTVFTGDNDTASIECAGGTYSGGGGNDTFYLHNPQTASAQPSQSTARTATM
jgi:hypothetical protein